ncbi:Prophage CP4-57 integrase [compost metagenome]
MNEAGFNADVIETALAHSDKNEVRRAYNRSLYLDKRIELRSWWGGICSQDLIDQCYNHCLNKHGFISSFFCF